MDQELARLEEDQARRAAEPPPVARCYLHLEANGTWSWSWKDAKGKQFGKKGFPDMFSARADANENTPDDAFYEEI